MLKKILSKMMWIFIGGIVAISSLFVFGKIQGKPRIGAYISNEHSLKEISKKLCERSIPFSVSISVPEKYSKEYKEIILSKGVSPELSKWTCYSK